MAQQSQNAVRAAFDEGVLPAEVVPLRPRAAPTSGGTSLDAARIAADERRFRALISGNSRSSSYDERNNNRALVAQEGV
jgi:hypothetical protein